MEIFWEVFVFEPESKFSDSKEFNNVRDAYIYANALKELGFEPYVARDYRVKV